MVELALEIKHLFQSFGGDKVEKNVLYDICLKVVKGQTIALVGPSGCGKSTLLNIISGILKPKEGKIILHKDENNAEPELITRPSRNVLMIPQQYPLYPHMTAIENVAIGLKWDETDLWQRPPLVQRFDLCTDKRTGRVISWKKLREIHLEEAAALLCKLGLAESLHKYPKQLSGGMQQRVAIARVLIMKPKILLMDEPFGALDMATRKDAQDLILKISEENAQAKKEGRTPPVTIIFVTHELEEAILVGDRVVCLSQYWSSAAEADCRAKGASTIIYDRIAPVFPSTHDVDFETFREQRDEVFDFAFNKSFLPKKEEFRLTFWDELKEGKGRGVLSNGK